MEWARWSRLWRSPWGREGREPVVLSGHTSVWLIAAEGAGEGLPKYAFLKVGDCKTAVHYAAYSPTFPKTPRNVPLCGHTLPELLVELLTVEWQVGAGKAAAREVGNLKTIADRNMTAQQVLTGAITRLIDEAAATLPLGNPFVENFTTGFTGVTHTRHRQRYKGADSLLKNLIPMTIDRFYRVHRTRSAQHRTQTLQQRPTITPDILDFGVEIPQPASVRKDPESATPPATSTTPTPPKPADPSPANHRVAKSEVVVGRQLQCCTVHDTSPLSQLTSIPALYSAQFV